MKAWLIAVVAAFVGIAIGTGFTIAEFAPAREIFITASAEPSPAADPSASAPKAVVEGGLEYDFGTMERDVKGEHNFRITNVGTAPLQIKVGHTTCKCTVAKLQNESLAPGESTDVKLEWEAKGYVDDFRQSAEVETNDPANRILRLAIHGKIIQSVRPIPEEIVQSGVSANEPTTAEVKIYGYASESLEIKQASLVSADYADHFQVTVAPLSESEIAEQADAKSGFRLKVDVKSGLPVGPVNQTIRVETNVPTAETIEIPVRLTVASDISIISATPGATFTGEKNLLRFGKLRSDKGAKGQLYVLVKGPHRQTTKIEIASVDPASALEATLGEATSLRDGAVLRYPLQLRIPPGTPAISRYGGQQGELGKIILQTTHPIAKEVRLYVQFAVE